MWNSAGDSANGDPPSDDARSADDGRENGVEEVPDAAGPARPADHSDGEEPVVAELAVEHEDIVLGDAIRAAPSVTVEPNYRTSDDRSPMLVFIAAGDSLPEFEAALASDHTITDPVRLAVTGDARAYRVRYGADALRFTPVLANLGGLVYDNRSDGRRWSFHVRFPSRAAFASFRNHCSENDVALELFRLYQADPTAGGGALGLTAQQWETLTTAHEMGYFEVPRRTTQEELARRLNVSPSAVSQRIRRATNQLLAATLDSSQFGARI